jgi:hypothetical protein
MPRSSTTLVISWMEGTACLCCVSPIAQQTIVRSEAANIRATLVICSRDSPVAVSTEAQSTSATWAR